MKLAVAMAFVGLGCTGPKDVTYGWDDAHVLCSISLDDLANNTATPDLIDAEMSDAADRGSVTLMHAHIPGVTVSTDQIERVLTRAEDHGLDFVTFADLTRDVAPRAALALAFDDNAMDAWFGIRDLLAMHGAHVTFFVSRWAQQPPSAIDELRQLAADGHDLEPHSVNHLKATDYVAANGLDTYMTEEVLPSIQVITDAGYQPTTFAYPFNLHDDAIDSAVLQYVAKVRTGGSSCR